MELSSQNKERFKVLNSEDMFDDKTLKKFASQTILSLLDKDYQSDFLNSTNSDVRYKKVHAALATLFLEAARYDNDATTFSATLEDLDVLGKHSAILVSVYTKHKSALQTLLASINSGPPHLVDVDWRLDYCLKDSESGTVNAPEFIVEFSSESATSQEKVQFSCNLDQMKDLVAQLKGACQSLVPQ